MPDKLNNMERKLATIINGTLYGLYERDDPDSPFVIIMNTEPSIPNAYTIVMTVDYYGNANRMYNQTIRHYAYSVR